MKATISLNCDIKMGFILFHEQNCTGLSIFHTIFTKMYFFGLFFLQAQAILLKIFFSLQKKITIKVNFSSKVYLTFLRNNDNNLPISKITNLLYILLNT